MIAADQDAFLTFTLLPDWGESAPAGNGNAVIDFNSLQFIANVLTKQFRNFEINQIHHKTAKLSNYQIIKMN